MKKVYLWLTIFFLTGCCLLAATTIDKNREIEVQADVAQEVLRFHVRANSEKETDQTVKMEVKEAVISYLQPILSQMDSVEKTREVLAAHLTDIKQAAETVLKNNHCSYGATVFLRKESFPEKTYGDCSFPAGFYEAVVIELGNGQGHNWWCMLYPGLCFVDETYGIVTEEKKEELKQVLTEDSYEWITEPKNRKITFRWEWLRKVLEFPI